MPQKLGEYVLWKSLQGKIKHTAMVRKFWKTSEAYAGSVKLIKTHKERKQKDSRKKKKLIRSLCAKFHYR